LSLSGSNIPVNGYWVGLLAASKTQHPFVL